MVDEDHHVYRVHLLTRQYDRCGFRLWTAAAREKYDLSRIQPARPVESPHSWISEHTRRSCYPSRGEKPPGGMGQCIDIGNRGLLYMEDEINAWGSHILIVVVACTMVKNPRVG